MTRRFARNTKILVGIILLAMSGMVPTLRAQETKPAGMWVNVTADVGGVKWGYAGVTTMAAVPGSDRIIAGVSEAGLWITEDRGKTWKKLGADDAVPIRNRPYRILFDPADSQIFWTSGSYEGPGA